MHGIKAEWAPNTQMKLGSVTPTPLRLLVMRHMLLGVQQQQLVKQHDHTACSRAAARRGAEHSMFK
jgi:hypothetical protein